jgi:hypothetical protein
MLCDVFQTMGILMDSDHLLPPMRALIARWLSSEVPVLNGGVLRSGRAHLIRPIDAPRILPLRLPSAGNADFGSLGELMWTHAGPYEPVMDASTGLVSIVGEGGMGADGFVAVQSGMAPDTLLWLAFFDFSNPFESVRFEDGFLKARNNLDEEWHFDLAEPWNITVFGVS